ncbi:MAG: hypothetical protein Kow0031_06530 [Anaerolineae bacterium]
MAYLFKNIANSEQNLTFWLLTGYRWVSLLLPLLWVVTTPSAAGLALLLLAAGLTLALTLAARRASQLLLRHPWLMAFDLALSAGLVWATGLEHSPYYLYSLAPILAAAFFFQIRGGLLAAATYCAFYMLAALLPRTTDHPADAVAIASHLFSFLLIGAIFGYPARLLQRLTQTHTQLTAKNDELQQRNRDLSLVRELSLVMQSSVDPAELQESILRGIVYELGYPRATIGLYNEADDCLSSWITFENGREDSGIQPVISLAHTEKIPLNPSNSPLVRAVKGKLVVEVLDGQAPSALPELNCRLVTGSHYIVLPLSLRGQPIGVILVDRLPGQQRLSATERLSLDSLATHAGVALGSLYVCIDRVQQMAVSEERNRIAIDLHDNVSQVLYGLAYGLDACQQLIDETSPAQPMLGQLRNNVTGAQALLRQTIFDIRAETITGDRFVAGLHRQMRALCPTSAATLRIELPGEFDQWPLPVRENLFQVAREALANVAKHARARQVVVRLARRDAAITMHISDDGRGFNPAAVDGTRHLGLHSMQERAHALNGGMEIISATGKGTAITVTVPESVGELVS